MSSTVPALYPDPASLNVHDRSELSVISMHLSGERAEAICPKQAASEGRTRGPTRAPPSGCREPRPSAPKAPLAQEALGAWPQEVH